MASNTTCFNLTCNFTDNSSEYVDIEKLLSEKLGERRRDMPSVVVLTFVYSLVFVSGTVGNISTCVVVAKNSYMHTTTNYYLFSLAVSDLLLLISCLPPEVYQIWYGYPWVFGEPFCIVKNMLMEMTAYASVLTITTFTIERYVAICHPLLAHKMADTRRAIKIIICLWVTAFCIALPYPINSRTFYYVIHPVTKEPISDSLICTIPPEWWKGMTIMFQISSFLFFVTPMAIITALYILIGITIRRSGLSRGASEESCRGSSRGKGHSAPRRAVLKMLVAVVVAFFLCWAPFHAQRFMALYVKVWTKNLHEVQSQLWYVSGILLYVSSTVNPILYNLMSKRYRQAFRETLCCCCWRTNSRRLSFGNSHTEHTVNNCATVRNVRFSSIDKVHQNGKSRPIYSVKRHQVSMEKDKSAKECLLKTAPKCPYPAKLNGSLEKSASGELNSPANNGRLPTESGSVKSPSTPNELYLSSMSTDNSRQQLLQEEVRNDNTRL